MFRSMRNSVPLNWLMMFARSSFCCILLGILSLLITVIQSWLYCVHSEVNSADLTPWGCKATGLSIYDSWLAGLSFLYQSQIRYVSNHLGPSVISTQEVTEFEVFCLISCPVVPNYFLEVIKWFSPLYILKCIVAWMWRFICNFKSHIPMSLP